MWWKNGDFCAIKMFIVVVIFYVWDMYTVVHSVYFGLRAVKKKLWKYSHHMVPLCSRCLFLMTWDISGWPFIWILVYVPICESGRCLELFDQSADFVRSFFNSHRLFSRSSVTFEQRTLNRLIGGLFKFEWIWEGVRTVYISQYDHSCLMFCPF